MKAYSINPQTRELKEVNLEMEANTVYSFFNSILIDESQILNNHVLYSDANAMNEKRSPFFLGGQITLGNVLLLGREGFEDSAATIPQEELESLIDYEVNQFYLDSLELISHSDVNLYRSFDVESGGETTSLSSEWVLYSFNLADVTTQEYFINELRKSIDSGVSVEDYMKKMAGLALNAAS